MEPTDIRRAALTSYYCSLDAVPAAGPVAPTGIDAATYSILLSHIEQLRPAGFLRPIQTDRSDFESAVAARSVVDKGVEDDVDSGKKDAIDSMEISSALHSALDDIQQILSAGPSSSHDHTHLDEQALGEITAFLQSGPPVIWPENDSGRLTNLGNNTGVLQQNAGFPVAGSIDTRLVKPAGKLAFDCRSESTSLSVDDSASAVVCLKRHQCVLCMTSFDLPPSTPHHNGRCSVCPGDILEVAVYRCRRCAASYYSESAAHHHALFLCTRDESGADIGCGLRHYSCPVCQLTFFSSAGLQSHTSCLHGTLQSSSPHSAVSKLDKSLAENKACQSDVLPQQSGVIQALPQLHSPFYVSSATTSSSPASAEENSSPYKVDVASEATTGDVAQSQVKPRTRRRYSGRPPKGIIYKNVFMTSEGLYYCSTCSADLNTVERRAEHRGRPCGRASAASYARHYVFICPHCSSRWSSQKACYEHQITTCLPQIGVNVADLSQRRYACPVCGRLHFSLAPLRGHMTTAHRLDREEVIKRLIAAGYMTPEGANVKFDNVVGIQEAGTAKPSSDASIDVATTITKAEIFALLNKELDAALDKRESGGEKQSAGDGKDVVDAAEITKKLESAASKLSVLTAYPQLPKPALNLRTIPKIISTSLLSAVMSSATSNPQTNVSFTVAAGTMSGVNGTSCNGIGTLCSIDIKSIASSNGDCSCVSSSTPVCSMSEELSPTVKDINTDDASLRDLKCETSENGDVFSSTFEVTSSDVSARSHTTSSVAVELEKQSNGCSDGVALRNRKLKSIFSKSDICAKSGQQIQLPFVSLERTTLTEITPTVGLTSSLQGSQLRPRQRTSAQFSSQKAISTRRSFSQSLRNLRKSAGSWKPNAPVLRIPINRPCKGTSQHFTCRRILSRGTRLVDRQLQKKKYLESEHITYDRFRDQRTLKQSRNTRQHLTASVSSGANTDAISTRSQCRQILKHSIVR